MRMTKDTIEIERPYPGAVPLICTFCHPQGCCIAWMHPAVKHLPEHECPIFRATNGPYWKRLESEEETEAKKREREAASRCDGDECRIT